MAVTKGRGETWLLQREGRHGCYIGEGGRHGCYKGGGRGYNEAWL